MEIERSCSFIITLHSQFIIANSIEHTLQFVSGAVCAESDAFEKRPRTWHNELLSYTSVQDVHLRQPMLCSDGWTDIKYIPTKLGC